jgi:hypothetical protein
MSEPFHHPLAPSPNPLERVWIPRHTVSANGPPLKPIHYSEDGISFTSVYACPSKAGMVPGVVVAHEALGVNEHVKARAQELAGGICCIRS